MSKNVREEKLPDRTVSRLSKYRRSLLLCRKRNKENIFSHELAKIHHITPVQVRRDIMLVGYDRDGTLRNGYNVDKLLKNIEVILDANKPLQVAIVGVGDLGKSLLHYFSVRPTKLIIKAAFDVHPEKIGEEFSGVRCYHLDKVKEIIEKENISIAIIAVPANYAAEVADLLVQAGIKGILNYTPTALNVPESVYLEEIDMISSLEKVAYFVKSL